MKTRNFDGTRRTRDDAFSKLAVILEDCVDVLKKRYSDTLVYGYFTRHQRAIFFIENGELVAQYFK